MKSLKNILIAVVLVSASALAFLSYDSAAQLRHRTPPLTEEVIKGKAAWQENNCINCHTILGNGAYFAPDLTKAAEKRSGEWLTAFLAAPDKVWPGTVMAGINLTSEEAKNLAAFLTWVKDIDTNGWPPKPAFSANLQDKATGKGVFDAAGCSGCHQITGFGGSAGPDLTNVGVTRDKAWLKRFLQNPREVQPNSAMPTPNISGESLDALVDYLSSLK